MKCETCCQRERSLYLTGETMFVRYCCEMLPLANKVWSKVIFLHLSVNLSIWGGRGLGGVGFPTCITGHMIRGLHLRGSALGGLHLGGLYLGTLHLEGLYPGVWADSPPDTTGCGEWVGSTHPTEMHSCTICYFLYKGQNILFYLTYLQSSTIF